MKNIKGLFDVKTELTERELTYIKDNFKGEAYCEQAYNKYKDIFPIEYPQVVKLNIETLLELTHAAAYYIYLNRETMYNNTDIEYSKLLQLLNAEIRLAYDENTKSLLRQGQGLGFLNGFIKEKLLSVTVAGKGPKTVTDRMQNLTFLYKVARKTIQMKAGFTLNRLFATAKIVDGQSVSNFRPLASAYLMHKYAIWKHPQQSEFNFWIPSEGWLGRLLSSYYTAYKNPDKQINYISTDPSGDVVSSFWDVVDYLNNAGGFNKLDNWKAEIRQHGSDVPEADFHKNENITFDLIWTSPPYSLGFEIYKDSYNILALDLETNQEVQITDKNGNLLSEAYILDSGQKVKDVVSGQPFTYNGKDYKLIKKKNLGQSHSKASTNFGWNEVFFRPTVKNAMSNLKDDGTMIWNVANVRTHKTLEDDVVRICTEEGFKHVDTLKYELSRVPGGIKQKDGSRVDLRKLKEPFEPVFVFEKQ